MAIEQHHKTELTNYLQEQQHKELLRFLTCGSVDDGKSSLIGRLLHDSKQIFQDQLAAIRHDSRRFNTTDQEIDLALLVDGLQSEREQGITIDVAYRYFSTDKRKFIIADTPGHEQYTRNMATGASNCNLAIILIDARASVKTQTLRHSYICSLLGIKQVVIAINKMDLVNYSRGVFERICGDYLKHSHYFDFDHIKFIPLSALRGDNVVDSSNNMNWYQGSTLLSYLESVSIFPENSFNEFRFPVQYVNRPDPNFRGFSGTVASGSICLGDDVRVWPSGSQAKINRIVHFDGDLEMACEGDAVTFTLDRDIDISRGALLTKTDRFLTPVSEIDCSLIWMHDTPLQPHRQYELRLGCQILTAYIDEIYYRVDINDFSHHEATHLQLNEIASCRLRFTQPVAVDRYADCKVTGAFILIDRLNNSTLAAGMIQHVDSSRTGHAETRFSAFELELNALIRRHFPHWEAKNLQELLP